MQNSWINIKELNFYSIKVRAKTHWKFMEFVTGDNISGISEITDTQLNSPVSKIIAKMSNNLRHEKIYSENDLLELLRFDEKNILKDRNLATAISGIRSAFLDLISKRTELSLGEYISFFSSNNSLNQKRKVDLYANINRSLLPDDNGPVGRDPEDFANKALEMEKRGFNAIKCAPFDECKSPFNESGKIPADTAQGLARLSAITETISKKTKLFVDCHSRFDLESSYFLHDELLDRNVNWFEEPVDPEKNQKDMIQINNFSKITTAGAEMAYGKTLMKTLLQKNVLDVVMPDVKFCGGPMEVMALDQSIDNGNNSISMHCPSGPVSLVTSAQITSVISSKLPLEHAVDEVSWRKELIIPNENIKEGQYILPEGNGIGIFLNPKIISEKGVIWQE